MKRIFPCVLLLLTLSCVEDTAVEPEEITQPFNLNSYSRLEISTQGWHEFEAETTHIVDTILFRQLNGSDTAVVTIADSVVDSKLYFYDYIFKGGGEGWENLRIDYTQWGSFAVATNNSAAALTLFRTDNMLEQWRTGARTRTAALVLETDSLFLTKTTADSAVFEGNLADARVVEYEHTSKRNAQYLEYALRYKKSLGSSMVRVVLRK